MVVKPETFIGWHRRAFQILWRWKSLGGRPRLPKNLRALIAEMVWQNPTWGEARVASELALKLGVRVSPRMLLAYWPEILRPNQGRSLSRKRRQRKHFDKPAVPVSPRPSVPG